MPLLERIKTLVFGTDAQPSARVNDDVGDRAAERVRFERESKPEVSTPANDPLMDEVAALGVQPVSKPWEIQEAQNPPRVPSRSTD